MTCNPKNLVLPYYGWFVSSGFVVPYSVVCVCVWWWWWYGVSVWCKRRRGVVVFVCVSHFCKYKLRMWVSGRIEGRKDRGDEAREAARAARARDQA
jgi:hypothetical protein